MIHGYKKKWPRRSYIGPLAKIQRDVAKTIRRKLKVPARVYRKPIARRSPERRRQDRIYNARVKAFLARPENSFCWCCAAKNPYALMNREPSTNVHHKHGRGWRGELLLVEELWVPCCTPCHPAWIDANRDEARRLGLLAPRGQYNRMPK